MVSVPLFALLKIKDARPAWPEQFRNLVAACEVDVSDRLPFGVVADWCYESGELELGEAFLWLFKRPDVGILKSQAAGRFYYALQHYPNTIGYVCGETGHGLTGLVVKLAERLAEMRRDLA